MNGRQPGGMYLIPRTAQEEIISAAGTSECSKLPKPGTNPRGVEFSKQALTGLTPHKDTRFIKILWKRSLPEFVPYKIRLDYWGEKDDG